MHAHMWPQWGMHSPQAYMYMANLAYGVTTTRDPQTSQADVVSVRRRGRDGRHDRPAHLRHRPRHLLATTT